MRKRKRRRKSESIAWQNKDIISKDLAERFRGESFKVYGVDLPPIEDVLPTNLPVIEAKELRMDNLFLLEDGSYALIDYESSYSEENKLKYLGYVAQVEKKLYNELKRFGELKLIILYTADVEPGKTTPVLDMGDMSISLREAFLFNLDSELIYRETEKKIKSEGMLTGADMMRIIVYPLTFKGDDAKGEAISRILNLIDKLQDDQQKRFLAKYLLIFTDKVIKQKDADRIRRMLMLTKVEQIIAKEMEEAVDKAVRKARREDRKNEKNKLKKIVENLLKRGDSMEEVSECTCLPLKEVEKIAGEIGVLQEA